MSKPAFVTFIWACYSQQTNIKQLFSFSKIKMIQTKGYSSPYVKVVTESKTAKQPELKLTVILRCHRKIRLEDKHEALLRADNGVAFKLPFKNLEHGNGIALSQSINGRWVHHKSLGRKIL